MMLSMRQEVVVVMILVQALDQDRDPGQDLDRIHLVHLQIQQIQIIDPQDHHPVLQEIMIFIYLFMMELLMYFVKVME